MWIFTNSLTTSLNSTFLKRFVLHFDFSLYLLFNHIIALKLWFRWPKILIWHQKPVKKDTSLTPIQGSLRKGSNSRRHTDEFTGNETKSTNWSDDPQKRRKKSSETARERKRDVFDKNSNAKWRKKLKKKMMTMTEKRKECLLNLQFFLWSLYPLILLPLLEWDCFVFSSLPFLQPSWIFKQQISVLFFQVTNLKQKQKKTRNESTMFFLKITRKISHLLVSFCFPIFFPIFHEIRFQPCPTAKVTVCSTFLRL